MRQGFLAAAVLAAGLFTLSTAQAASSPKIGVVDINAVITNCHRGQQANQVFQQIVEKLRAQLGDLNDKRKAIKDQIDKTDSKSADYQKLLKQFEDANSIYQQSVAAGNQDVQQRKQDLLQPIQQEMVQVLDRYARDNHYDIILTKNVGAAFASDSYDVTSAVTEAMDKDWAELQKAQASKAPAAATKH